LSLYLEHDARWHLLWRSSSALVFGVSPGAQTAQPVKPG